MRDELDDFLEKYGDSEVEQSLPNVEPSMMDKASQFARNVGRASYEQLPAIGAMAGGFVGAGAGGVGALPGAALGGAGGAAIKEALRPYVEGESNLLSEQAKEIAMGAATGVGQEMGGQVIGKIAGATTKGLQEIANKAAIRSFGVSVKEAAELGPRQAGTQAIEAGAVNPLKSRVSSYEKLTQGIEDIGEKEIRPHLKSDRGVDIEDIKNILSQDSSLRTTEQIVNTQKLLGELDSLAGQKPKLSPEDLYELKMSFDRQAGYKAAGGVSNEVDKIMADQIRSSLKQSVPEVIDPLQRQQNLITMRKSIGQEDVGAGVGGAKLINQVVKTVTSKPDQVVAVTADKVARIFAKNPQALGRYLALLINAQKRGEQSYKATIHVLQQDPEFRAIVQQNESDDFTSDEESSY